MSSKQYKTSWIAVAIASLALLVGIGCGSLRAEDKGKVVIVSWGGTMQDSTRAAMFQPFEKETGIKVEEATFATLAKVQAMVTSGNIEWDVMSMVAGDALVAAQKGLLEKLDYSKFDQSQLKDIDPRVVQPYGVGYVFYSKVLAYNTKRFPEGTPHPASWADFWDLKKFPGPRLIDAGNAIVPPIEFALLADGVPLEKLYPLDLERAYKSLAVLKPSVVKWATTPAMAPQALIDGEADMVAVSLNRITPLIDKGAPINFVWNGGMLSFDYWTVPKGSKNFANAMKFIEYALRPEVLAAFAKLEVLGPTNKKAYDFLTTERARVLPSSPDNLRQQFVVDLGWWSSIDASGKSNVQKNQEMWSAWILK
jgi:putative spermidine/putrescine transport system substrate-binding protein